MHSLYSNLPVYAQCLTNQHFQDVTKPADNLVAVKFAQAGLETFSSKKIFLLSLALLDQMYRL